ncbi:MAG TPA: carboxypeptidase-like regulatory domain-containing protein [Candidatus Sulfotelmatobacter sp.]|nr:carboxypeptidase-like regulatory domain-containing protein [Candidatus Sulfotelmatobacter sp.]
MKIISVGLLVFFLAVAILALNPGNVFAQTGGTGIVVGTVTDPSGAAVPGATVTLTDTATNAERTATTNDTGRYNFPNVPPGNYNVTISKTGFRVAKIVNQTVAVAESRTLDARLEVGATTQTVEVTATNTELQTMNATIGNTVSGNTLSSLPSLGRDVSSFVTMQPGVSPDGSVGGTVVDQANFMLDGGNNSNDMDGSGGVYNASFGDDPTGGLFSNPSNPISGSSLGINGNQPSGVMPTPIDSVEEFKVATSNQTADFNASSGMEVQIVTKRGTNTWHGTAYEYYLDNTMSGNTWQNNNSGVALPDWHRSWFGVAVGGPVIPKEVFGGKTYFFFNYQGARWPYSESYDRLVPSADMVNGILHDPACLLPGAAGPCSSPIYTYNLNTLDPRGIGANTYVQQMWKNHMPASNLAGTSSPCGPFTGDGICDGVNTFDYRANLAIPQNDNFAVVRLDHDFGAKWHFMSSYRYYHLANATDDQVDIGGFFSGDKLGTPASLTNHPQVPWYLVVGMTTNISSNVTNDFRYSFLRNYWAWASAGDPAQFSNLAAALEPFGETTHGKETLAPYNVNTQQTRTRFWDGHDSFIRDDVSWLKGTHFFQFGGQYQRNWNYHERTDNGVGTNYYPVYLLGSNGAVGGGNVDFSLLGPAFATGPNAGTLDREAAAVLGIVTQTQQAYTRAGANLQLNPPLTPAFDKVTIPYYNLYFGDSWRVKPSITLNYGLGWALEMPPVEDNGKQVILVDANDKPISTEDYLDKRKAAALAGQVYNPEIGFALINNVAGHPKYPFDPFYHGFSPRIAVAWNPGFDSGFLGDLFGKNKTVVRGGYGRIYGRVNGVSLVLTPLLSPGIIQAVGCSYVLNYTTTPGDGKPSCQPGMTPNVNTAFRIGTDGTTAPLPPATNTLPQPFYPGINGAEALNAAPLDPHFKPNAVDSIDLSVQRQFTPRMSVEVGVISRWIHNELQNININAVPYMMTLGGQQFAAAYANVEKAMGCATSESACSSATVSSTLANLKSQAFFEAALAGTGYCTPGTCTATVVTKEFANFQTQNVWTLWSDLDNGGSAPGFNFPFSMMNTAGQIASNVTPSTSLGYGNYNAGFITFKMNDWHGVTLQNNFTYSKALGTGAVIQATSAESAVDPYNLNTQYGLQPFDRKFVDTLFFVYQPPYYRSQQGFVGHILGGWTFSPIFTAGSGAPDFCNTNTGGFSEGYSGGQDWGSADATGTGVFTTANCILTNRAGTSASVHNVNGVPNMFANPAAVFANVRPPILGLDGNIGGFGQFRGLAYWNMNLGAKKNVRITERVNVEASFNFINVFNHNQFLDPTLNISGQNPSTFGQLSTEGTVPRTMEFGIRVNF